MSNAICFLPVVRHLFWSSRRMTFRSIRFSTLAILLSLASAALHPGLLAQNICGTTTPVYPCLDQPQPDTKITGRLTAVGVAPPAGATVKLEIGSTKVGDDVPVQPDGSFSFNNPGGLNIYNDLKVTQVLPVAPLGLAPPSTGPVHIKSPAAAAKLCTKSERPCLNQPNAGDVQLTGSLTTDAVSPPAGTAIDVKIDSTKQSGLATTVQNGNFTVKGLQPLNIYNKIEVVQSAPVVPSGNQPTTGEVAVMAAKSFNLGLSIPAASASLDFGHQPMALDSAGKQVTITNTSDKAIDLDDPSTTLTSNNYRITSNSCTNTLQPKAACSFQVIYAPFRARLEPGTVENDFIILVPKGNPGARDEYNLVVGELNQYRNGISSARQQVQIFHRYSASSDSKVKSAVTETNKLLSQPSLTSASSTAQTNEVANRGSIRSSQTQAIVASITADYAQGGEWSLNQDKRIAAAKAARNLSATGENEAIQDIEQNFQVISLSGIPDHWKYPLTRAVVGIDLSAPSATQIKQSYFVDFDLLAPLTLPGMSKFKNEDPLENRLWLWFNPRITSLPQATNFSALSTIDETGSFFGAESSKGTLGDIQGLDINGGFEFAIVKPRDGIPWWAEYANTQARLAPSLIIGGGMSTPFSTSNTDVISQSNPGICDAFSLINPNLPPPVPPPTVSTPKGLVCGNTGPTGTPANSSFIIAPDGSHKMFVDFFTPERSRFFRKYYGGVRLKTYFFSRLVHADCNPPSGRGSERGDCDGLYDIFPGVIDLTFGQDEAVTAGHLSTWLLRLEAVYPLPFYQGIHIFASAYTALKRNNLTQPYNTYSILTPAAGMQNDFNTFRFGIQPLDRDYFRVGIGIDLIQVFKKASSGGQPSKTAAAPTTAPTTTTTD